MNFDKLEAAGINTEELLKRLMGNSAYVKVFINKFTSDATFNSLNEAFAQNDMKSAELASHTLKGMCGNLSLTSLFKLFTQQVDLLRSGEFDKANDLNAEISSLYNQAVFNMMDWLSDN